MAVFIPPTGDAVVMLGLMKFISLGKQNATLWNESWLVSIHSSALLKTACSGRPAAGQA